MTVHTVFVALGSNMSDPRAQVLRAIQALDSLPHTRVAARSSLYRSAPIGFLQQPDFINAVVRLDTELAPKAILNILLELERNCGRTRDFLNAPRTLDLDILLYDDLQYHEQGLTIPHPQMHKRAFVLQPLLEIAPDCAIPGIGPATEALLQCCSQKSERVEDAA
jgi:2-amino-4-hydroxy-6-hydroxymethyldihydropteridine diphosphokinase